MDIVYNKLMQIKDKPTIYLGAISLKRLCFYISGYVDRERELNPIYQCEFLNKFQTYIQDRYKITSTHHWSSIIRFYSATGQDAFNLFYKHLDDFFEDHPEIYEQVTK